MLFKTHDMEAAIRALHGYYHRVLVRNAFVLPFPVRLRTKLLADIEPYIARKTGCSEQISRWQKNGGTLIAYDPKFQNDTHQVEVRCEAPFSMSQISGLGIPGIVYAPPSWRGHWEAINRVASSKDLCLKILDEIRKSPLDKRHAAICDKLGFDTSGVSALTDNELCERIGTDRLATLYARTKLFWKNKASRFTVTPIVPNLPPARPELLPMYNAICALPDLNGVKLAYRGELWAVAEKWRSTLRRLQLDGAVSVKDRITFYSVDSINPDFGQISIEHETAKNALAEVEKTVDAMPEFSLDLLIQSLISRPEKPQPSTAPGQRAV